jgi:hypothetical protein
MSARIPVILNYNYDDLIGYAKAQADGKLTITLTDPRIIQQFRQDDFRSEHYSAVSLDLHPAEQKPEYAHIYANTEHELLGKMFADIAFALGLPIVGFCGEVYHPRRFPPNVICPECIAEMARRQTASQETQPL